MYHQCRSQLLLQRLDQALIFGDATSHHIPLFSADALDQRRRFGGNGLIQSVDNVVGSLVLGNQGDHLGLGKDGAHTGDRDILLVFQAHPAHLVQAHLHGPGHHFQKAACPSGAFVVHHEIDHRAVFVQADDLAVLSANVNDRPHRWVKEVGASGVTGDLGDALVTL